MGDRERDARERVLATAEALFSARGYDSVTLRDVAAALGMRQASLYHHFPHGKEQLYVEAMERVLRRHQAGLEAAIAAGGAEIRPQLRGAARWLLSQPPMNLARMVRSDLPAIAPEHADRLIDASFRALLVPVDQALRAAQARGEIGSRWSPTLMAGTFVVAVEGLWDAGGGRPLPRTREEMADELIDALLDGLRAR